MGLLEDASECQQRLDDRVHGLPRVGAGQTRRGFSLSQSFSVLRRERSTDDADLVPSMRSGT
jgi:hypothetical protein